MERALLILFLLLLATFCPHSALQGQDTSKKGTPVSVTQLGPKRSGPRGPFMSYSGIEKQLRIVIRDRDTWGDMWKQIHSRQSELPPLPEIDFSCEMIIFVSLGERPTGGYGIIIEGVYERDDRLEVNVQSISPGKNCFVTQALTAPIDIVRLPKTNRAVSFQETESVHDCK